MPTELLHREKIYCREWYNTATDEWFRLSIIPERKIGNIYSPDGGFTLHKIPNSVIKETTEFESSLKDLRIGMIDTPTIDLTLSTNAMPDALKYIILYLENSTNPDDKYYTNTWIFQSDRGTSRETWFNEFIGIQRKTPGMKLTLYRGGEVPKTNIKITLMPLARLILEQVQMKSICESAFAMDSTTGLGVLNTSGILTSYPYDLDLHANKIRITGFTTLALEHAPSTGSAYLRPLSLLFYVIWYEQQLLLRKYLRNNSIELTYENVNGERRFPHDNVQFRNFLGTDFIDQDKIYYLGKMAGTYNGESIQSGGLLDLKNNVGLTKFLNVYDFYEVMTENFPSCFLYFNNINLDIETYPSGTSVINIDTLEYSGKMHFNFVRLQEKVNKTDDDSTQFNVTSEQRNVSVLSCINDNIDIEQGASLIRSATAERTKSIGIIDLDKIENRTDSILSEQEFSIATIFETSFNLPEEFRVGRNSGGDTIVGVIDKTGYAQGLLYYYDGTESTPAGVRPKVYKVHEVVSYITNEAGDLVTYDDVDEVNEAKISIMGKYDSIFAKKIKYDFEPNGINDSQKSLVSLADLFRRAEIVELHKKSGLCFSASKYVLETFSKRNQSLIEMSLDKGVAIQSNWLADFFNLEYWDIVDDYTPFIQSKASLISIKKNLTKGTTEVKFLTEGI